jgi:ABC-type branched-subunit amino acid transport system substrate-binding protein
VCESAKACLTAIRRGDDVRYRGVALRRSGFTDVGEPSTASYATLTFGRDDRIDEAKTEFVGAGDESAESRATPPSVAPPPAASPSSSRSPASAPAGLPAPVATTRPLTYGLLMPRSGSRGPFAPAKLAAARLAVADLNETGGVLGAPVNLIDADDGDRAELANAAVNWFVNSGGVQVVIAAGSSSVCQAVLPRAVGAGVVTISPTATSDGLSKIDDKGLFFRTAPPDALQAKALADIVMRDGSQRVVVVARDDLNGTSLQHSLQRELSSAGVKNDNFRPLTYRVKEKYDPATDPDDIFKPVAKSITLFAPDAVVLIGYPESAHVIRAMLAEGTQVRN